MPRTAFNSRRTRTSCSVIALATVLTVGATPAAAQSFLGTGTYVTNPNATGIQTGAGTTTINLNSGQTVIDWVPSDPIPGSTITFQTAGTTATFTTASGNFAVLNRITPTDMSRAIAMNGTVNGRIGGVNGVQGGSVYFYSPNGFVFGGSSVFNVGSLVVTTSPIQLTGNLFINGADNTVVFGQTPNPNAAIINNAAIDANFVPFGVGGSGTSYVAMVAPRVVHNGSIDVNGSAALVGAEAATISFSPDGLFDIQVTVGTDDANGVAVNGDIGGVTPDSDEQQRIFLVAVPKNDAMTMVIGAGADLGFDLAGSAAIDDNGAIILSAGKDITNGVIGDTSAGHSETAVADFWFTGAHATNNLFGDATGTAYLYSTIGAPGQQTTIFDNDVTVHGDVGTHMASSGVGSTLTVGGDLYLSSDAFATESGGSAAGGSTVIFAQNGGSLTVSGDAVLTANGHGGSTESPGEAGGTGTGGLVSILALSDGTLSFEGALEAQASGYGGQSFDGDGGLGQGGSLERPGGGGVQILASDATLTVTGSVDLTATGEGGGGSGTGNVSGNGVGGDIFVQSLAGGSLQMASLEADATGRGGLDFGGEAASGDGFGGGWNDGGGIFIESNGGSSLIITGAVDLFANGEAGSGGECFSCGGAAGDGFGGDIFALANGTGSTLTFGDLDAQANGYGGLGSVGNGGLGDGGSVQLSAWGSSTTTVNGDADLDAIGYGGDVVANSTGGNGVGGAAFLTTANTGTLQVNGDAFVDAYAEGGNVFNEIGGIGGGDATGGNAQVLASGGTLNVDGSLFVNAYGQGGFAFNGTGGDGTGNSAQIRATGGDIDIDGSAHVDASGYGGTGEIGGSGTGGGTIATFTPGAMIFAQNGDIDIGFSATVAADGIGAFGNDGDGGNGTGGWASIESGSGSTVDVLGTVEAGTFISARGEGGGSEVAAGGDGFGGTATVVSTSGDLYLAGDLIVNAGATGGTGGTTGGDAIARITPPAQEETTPAVSVYATGGGLIEVDGHTSLTTYAEGGTGYDGAGGIAQGGEIDVVVGGTGTITLAELTATADALGGSGGNGGNGGNATGGNIDIGWNLSGTTINGTITATETALSANGEGGAGGAGPTGGDGGSGTGGEIFAVASAAGGTLSLDNATIFAQGRGGAGGDGFSAEVGNGGDGGNGGAAEGGLIFLGSVSSSFAVSSGGSGSYGNVLADASAFGGNGGAGGFGSEGGTDGLGGDGGNAIGGQADLRVRGVAVTADSVDLIANATGGNGGAGSTAGAGGDAATGFVVVESINRSGSPTQRGSLTALGITGSAVAQGGTGSTNGTSTLRSGSYFSLVNGDAQIFVLDMTFAGDEYDGTFGPNYIQAQNGVGNISGLSYDTTGELAVYVAETASITGTSLFLTAGNFVDFAGAPEPADPGTMSYGNATILTGQDIYVDADLNIGSSLEIDAPGLIHAHDFTVDGDLRLVANGSILADDLTATGHIGLATPSTITAGDVDAGGVFMALAHGDMSFGDATATEVFLSDYGFLNPGGLTATCVGNCGTLGANGVVTAPPTGPTYAYVTTNGGIDDAAELPGQEAGSTNGSLYTTSEFEVSAGTALDFFFNYVTSDGSTFADYAWAGLYTPSLDPVAILYTARTQPSGTIVPGFGLPGVEATLDPEAVPIIGGAPTWSPLGDSSGSCFAAGCGYTGWVSSSYEIAEAGTYVLRFGVTNFSDTGFDSGMAFSGLSIGGVSLTPTLLTPTGGSITIGNVETGKFSAAAGTSLTTGVIDSDGAITLGAGGAIATDNLFAGDFVLANGGSITTGNIEANSVDMTSTGGNVSTGDILALGSVELNAFVDIMAGDITAGSIDLAAGNDITTDNLTTQFLVLLAAQEGPGPSFLFPGASITLESGGDIATGNIDSIDGVYANAGGGISTGTVEANTFVELLAVGNIVTNDITAFSQINIESSSGGITTQDLLSTDGDIDLDAFGNVSFATADADTEFDFSAGGTVNGGNAVAGNQISGDAGGTVTLGNLTVNGPLLEGEPFSIGIVAADDITVGNVTGAHGVGLATLGDLSTGNINAGPLFMALVGGNTTVGGSITTSGEGGGQVYIANPSMCTIGGGCDDESDFSPGALLALDPVATGGSITINGPVTTGLFQAAAGTNFTAQAINAGFGDIEVWAGGMATVNGAWVGSDIDVTSGNIDITANGTITASDIVTLHSTNSQQTLIGDGLSGTGYALSNAEFGRVRGDSIAIVTGGVANAAADTLVGDLTITAGESGNIRDPEGGFGIVTLDESGESPDGTLRVVGDVAATGLTLDNFVAFVTEHFQLDAATGSISLTSTGDALSGELGLYADTIHVAEGSILDLLADNSTYTGYQQDLNEAATVQRPEGVLRADTLWIESENLQEILIQNTGTAAAPAGFLVRQAFVNEDFEVAGPPGSINLIVNGQVVTEGGTLTGVAARDALITEETDITPFTSNSTINGCPLTGACIIVPPPPPTADLVDNFIDLLGNDPLGDSDFGNEESIDDNEEGDEGANNPISPPQPLFDTRPLIPSGDVNDPVSGTGNPALLGSDQQCETEEGGQCPAAPVNGDGQ